MALFLLTALCKHSPSAFWRAGVRGGCEARRQRLRPRAQLAGDDKIATQERQVLGAGLM